MNEYRFLLKNEKAAAYQRISLFIILLQVLIFLYLGLYASEPKLRKTGLMGASVIVGSFLVNLLLKKIKAGWKIGFDALFFFIVMVWTLTGYYWISLIPAILFGMASISMRKLEIVVTKYAIQYPSVPMRRIEWKEISNVVLKDGLLTIDLKNNKLIQQYVGDNTQEEEFNEFCRRQLELAIRPA